MTPVDGGSQAFTSLQVALAPIATLYTVARVRINGADHIAIKFDDCTGAKVVFFDLAAAKGLADTVRATALGLTLVSNNNPLQKDGNP